MIRKKMLLFGGSGKLGTRIRDLLDNKYEILSPTRFDIDFFSKEAIKAFLKSQKFEVVVYAAGITNQDIAEKEKKLADQINTITPFWIAESANLNKYQMIYFSTDAVFNGRGQKPYLEVDKTEPVNYYGKSKANGEKLVLETGSLNTIIRLISLYSPSIHIKQDFVQKIVTNLDNKERVLGIKDVYFNPTFCDNAVNALDKIIEKRLRGIYHIGATDCISNFSFTKMIANMFNFDKKLIDPVAFVRFNNKSVSKRGKNCCLDVKYSREVLGTEIIKSNLENLIEYKKLYAKFS